MTRILFWNIPYFGEGKLFPPPLHTERAGPNPKRRKTGDPDFEWLPGYQADPDAQAWREVLIGVLQDVKPDIISIVELITGGAPLGTVVADHAALWLLRELRAQVANDFRLVPPVTLGAAGKDEAIAVYYRDQALNFLGPWGSNGAGADSIANIGLAHLAGYQAPWSGGWLSALPNRPVGPGWPTPAAYNEQTLAGQWQYRDALGNLLTFPAGTDRTPWLTWFGDKAGARVIKLISFHASPKQLPLPGAPAGALAPAVEGVAALARVREMSLATALAANEIRVIAGDFNISAWDDGRDPASYAQLRAQHYIQQLNPRGRTTPGVLPNPPVLVYGWPQAGYYATLIRDIDKNQPTEGAHPWVSTGPPAPAVWGYPGFGWAGRQNWPWWFDAIDNFFTRHAAGNAGPLTVANPITKSPYNAVGAPPNVQTGIQLVNSRLADPTLFGLPPWIAQIPGGGPAYKTFCKWENYPKIRGLSDHLPIVIDV